MLTDVAGVQVGHWTDSAAKTGCTVVILPQGAVASGEVRGGAPATREFEVLNPAHMVQTIDAVVLSGGSAFGLAAGDGVMAWLGDQGRGFVTKQGNVPIVVGMSLYDLGVGDPTVRPGQKQGRAAAAAASATGHEVGLVGAGTGATVGKWGGPSTTTAGGIGAATKRLGDLTVSALVAVNAVGFIDDGTSTDHPGPRWQPEADPDASGGAAPAVNMFNTTIGVIVCNAVLDKRSCHLLAQSGHDGMARSVHPSHTMADGDALVAAATGGVEADLFDVRLLGQHAVTEAIRSLQP